MKKMNLLAFSIMAVTIFNACKKKADPDPLDRIPSHSFINQDLQGTIAGTPWKFQSGSRVRFSKMEDVFLYLTDTTIANQDTCYSYGYGTKKIRLSLPLPLKLKTYGLAGDLYTCKFDDGSKEVTAVGAIEIMSVTSLIVTGRIDAKVDNNNSVNGNFRIRVCPD